MPHCPHCETPYEPGERYCSNCGSFLLHPEQGDTFCPQCGVRVSPRQEFCHECDAPIKGAPAAISVLGPAASPDSARPAEPVAPTPARKSISWLTILLIGAGIAIILLLVLLFTYGMAPAPGPKTEAPPGPSSPGPLAAPAPAPPPTGTAPAQIPETAVKENLQDLLTTLKEAQLHQDISQFLSAYSPNFPDLEHKRANILRSWQHYTYLNLFYTIDKLRVVDPDNAIAWVTWYIDTKNRQTQEIMVSTQSYQVRLAKEDQHWRIRSLEEVTP